MKHHLYIGTSGWQYPHWKGTFYPADLKQAEHFSYYLDFFDTVEINNTFYRLPEKTTFTKWRKAVPKGFVYTVKASRFITHMKKLKDPKSTVYEFMDRIKELKGTLGPVLFQLPPKWNLNKERLEEFLRVLPGGIRYVFEFRNTSWYDEEVYDLLQRYHCGFCIYELAGHVSPVKITADFVYLRLHGPGDKYQGSYTDTVLKKWAKTCKTWLKTKDVYVYFDNDQAGYAAFNAIRLNELINKQGGN
jgi:uncharacterized protein YecE (DUF72 family)